jgi:hypothetical protein
MVVSAVRGNSIIPLDGLAGAFPTTADRFSLAYGESVSAVDRIVRVNGRDALVKLIRSYHDGVSDDEAFQAALGRDLAGFEADWLAELGATPPVRQGPQPAPAGPLPAGWSGPRPNPSFEVVGSALPGAPVPATPTGSGAPSLLVPSLALGVGLLAVALAALAIRRTRRTAAAASRARRPATHPLPARASTSPDAPDSPWFLPRDVDPPDDDTAARSPFDPPPDPPDPGAGPSDAAAGPPAGR